MQVSLCWIDMNLHGDITNLHGDGLVREIDQQICFFNLGISIAQYPSNA